MLGLTRDDKLDLLAEVPPFRGLSRRQLRDVARLLDLTDVAAGRRLTTAGERGLEFFVVVDGVATVERGGAQVATLATGDVIGELALLGDEPRTATVTAATAMRVLVGERRALVPLLDADPAIREAILEAASIREQQNAA